jgi:peptidoglycan hydrolase CwlO-like protein
MKIGTSIFWLVIILIAFGYLLSDNQHMRKDLREVLAQMEGLNGQVVEADEKLNSCLNTVQDDQQLISQQRAEITSLHSAMTVKEGEIGSLKALLTQQSSRISELEG